ncbi:hypothetical protein [Desulfovibrio litoralis]|uniref:Zinc-or iron-chelating domain-containing protein n=1 Tax=Desulfovibrio litoralis DSM 11393 TaxID=1121455 RepID=A0A1M7RT58_9BACT|nr:hypothetical protein [Desulfovibrio litoralis]SHN49459.1 hypothetical protein SAMN02745728_00136 [Desulfovibrio litoralis DSM 11393]
MIFDVLKDVFTEYEKLSASADQLFDTIKRDFSDCVSCKEQCSGCCHALFDLSLVEAMYLNKAFKENFNYGAERSTILEYAGKADRRSYKFKRLINKELNNGTSPEEIMKKVGQEKQRCPLLGSDERCILYNARPITCKLYGIPTTINGNSNTCHLSNFKAGTAYPSVNLDKIQDKLAEISMKIGPLINSSYSELHLVYVPVSTALLTEYDEKYLGVKQTK